MNITELDSYNLADAVKFNDTLNPAIWAGEKMKPEVRERLLVIAEDFKQSLGLSDLEVKDITVSGSNAGYTYTPHSDIDLHLVVDIPQADESAVYRELFDAKKYQYNDQHNITIGGYDVELYVEDARKQPVSQGIYSVLNGDWVKIPRKVRATVNDEAVRSKFEDVGHRIESAIASGNSAVIEELTKKIKNMRQAGLDAHGELGPENLAYKMLRNQGMIKKLYDARMAAQDAEFSLNERRRKKAKKKTKYGYGGYFYPGFGFAGSGEAPADGGGDGGGGESRYREDLDTDGIMMTRPSNMSSESVGDNASTEDTVQDFVNFCVDKLNIENTPRIRFKRDPAWSKRNKTFGSYNHDTNELIVSLANRHVMDILRTVAHELTHQRQGEVSDMPKDAGKTGSRWENEANAKAGVLMREYGQQHPDLFAESPIEEGYQSDYDKIVALRNSPRYKSDRVKGKTELTKVPQRVVFGGYTFTIDPKTRGVIVTHGGKTVTKYKYDGPDDYNSYVNSAETVIPRLRPTDLSKIKAQGTSPTVGRHNIETPAGQGGYDVALPYDVTSKIYQQHDQDTQDYGVVGDINDYAKWGNIRKLQRRAKQQSVPGTEVDEGWKDKAAGLAAAACIAGTPGCATTQQGLKTVQDVGRTAQAVKSLNKDRIQAELDQELKNYLRAKSGQSGEGNLSRLYKLEKQVTKEASGYIPTKAQAKLPQFSNALSVDVQPGAVGKEANKLNLKTDSQGHPELLIKGLKNALREFKETGKLDRLGNQRPTGPETKPTMPAGTLRVDVSDVYDWYKLGQHISDLEGLGQHDFGQGPPSSIISFGDEDTEHKFIDNLKATGLDVTDIDPVDPKKRPGRKIKTDPTYNVNESEQLDEVKMSPGALRKFANSPEAEGIMAGFEAELIFRDTRADEDDGEMEYDMDYDERTSSIDEVVEFFMHDDYGMGLSDRGADRLREQLDNAYFEWRDDQVIRDFENESEDLVREVWLEERPMPERILSALTDGIGLDDAEADRVLVAGEKAPRFTKNADQEAYKQENPDYATYLEAADIADEILDEEVEASISNQDGVYDQALENFQENWEGDDSSFFSDIGLRWMSDIMNEYGLDWPYMTGGGGNGGSREWADIAGEIQQVTGMPVEVGYGYHTKKRVPNEYVLEPDGSLSPDDESSDYGLELVSPPMPLNKAIEQLEAIIDWANSDGNAYTNSSTGLHMGISIPFKGGDVDYLKLILFMGDQYVLEKFGRAANTYTASAFDKLRQNVAGSKNRGDTKIASAMELMKNNLIELAQRYVQQGVGNAKYTSAHIKPGYIEFRSPGGDYLSAGDQGEQDILADTMRRFAYAMYLAGRPDLERPEYYKKLYKLIAPDGGEDLNLFAKFSSGELTAEELKKQWAEKVINKEVPGGVGPKSNWKLYNKFTNKPVAGVEFNNYTEMDALERAKARVSPASSMTDFKQTYELRDVGTNTGRWSVIRLADDEPLEIVDAPTRGAAADLAYEKYTDVIPFYIEPYSGGAAEPEPKLSRRAQLAKQIAQPKDYVIINKHSMLPFYTFRASTMSQAVDFAITYLNDKNLDIGNFTVQKASNVKQAIDNRVDSKQLQQRVDPQVRDVEITVDQDRVQYEIVNRITGRPFLQYSADDADDARDKYNTWLRNNGFPQDTENYGWRVAQTVNESIDDAQKARNAMDRVAKEKGYANWSAVPPNLKISLMKQAVDYLNKDPGHYNMLDKKNKHASK
jgi:hypothetical protein